MSVNTEPQEQQARTGRASEDGYLGSAETLSVWMEKTHATEAIVSAEWDLLLSSSVFSVP